MTENLAEEEVLTDVAHQRAAFIRMAEAYERLAKEMKRVADATNETATQALICTHNIKQHQEKIRSLIAIEEIP